MPRGARRVRRPEADKETSTALVKPGATAPAARRGAWWTSTEALQSLSVAGSLAIDAPAPCERPGLAARLMALTGPLSPGLAAELAWRLLSGDSCAMRCARAVAAHPGGVALAIAGRAAAARPMEPHADAAHVLATTVEGAHALAHMRRPGLDPCELAACIWRATAAGEPPLTIYTAMLFERGAVLRPSDGGDAAWCAKSIARYMFVVRVLWCHFAPPPYVMHMMYCALAFYDFTTRSRPIRVDFDAVNGAGDESVFDPAPRSLEAWLMSACYPWFMGMRPHTDAARADAWIAGVSDLYAHCCGHTEMLRETGTFHPANDIFDIEQLDFPAVPPVSPLVSPPPWPLAADGRIFVQGVLDYYECVCNSVADPKGYARCLFALSQIDTALTRWVLAWESPELLAAARALGGNTPIILPGGTVQGRACVLIERPAGVPTAPPAGCTGQFVRTFFERVVSAQEWWRQCQDGEFPVGEVRHWV